MIEVPGATPEEIAAIAAVLFTTAQDAPGTPPSARMSPWKRAGREPDLDFETLRHGGDRCVF